MMIFKSILVKMFEANALQNSTYRSQDYVMWEILSFYSESIHFATGLIFFVLIVFGLLKLFQIKQHENKGTSLLVVAVIFALALIATPLIILVFITFLIYRLMVYLYLRRCLGQNFGGLMKGPDAVWACELPEARSIITTLLLLEVSSTDVACSHGCYGKTLLQSLRQLTENLMLNPSGRFPKLMQLRGKSSLGYHYWIIPNNLEIDSFVRFLDIRTNAADGLTELDLKEIIGEHCNKPLPYEDTATWDVFVGQQHLIQTETTHKLFPVLFRFHHSVGDGVALLRLLIESVADRVVENSDLKLNITENPLRKFDEDSGYENESHESTIPKVIAVDAIESMHSVSPRTDLKTKIRRKFGSFRSALTPEKKLAKFPEIPKSLVSKFSSVCRRRRNTLSGVPKFFELKNQEIPRARSVTPDDNINILDLDNIVKIEVLKKDATIQTVSSFPSPIEQCSLPAQNPHFIFYIPTRKDAGILLTISVIVTFVTVYRALVSLSTVALPCLREILKLVFFTPHNMFSLMIAGTEDQVLYGKPLTGEKVVSWIVDHDGEATLKEKIRFIKSKLGVKFTHILFACLSRSLSSFYLQRETIPSRINIALPARVDRDDLSKGLQTTATCKVGSLRARVTRLHGARRALKRPFQTKNLSFSSSTESEPEQEFQQKLEKLHKDLSNITSIRALELSNKFTVAMMSLPIADDILFSELVNSVKEEYDRLRNAPDYVANYWLLRWVAHLTPFPLLSPILAGAPCSLILSNLPGPEDVIQLAKKPIHDIVFWIPNRGLTGVGIGILSYCQRFSLGIVADKALIADPDEAHRIIAGIFDELNSLVDIFGDHSKS